MRPWLHGLCLCLIWWVADGASAASKTEARLLLASEIVRPGDTVMAGIELKMAPNWHTYWRNAGDSGAPTVIEWQLPRGVQPGAIQWPVPEKLTVAGLTTYVYHNQVLIMVPVRVAADLPPGKLELKAKVSWLECEELCLPGDAAVKATLLIGSESKPSSDFAQFEAARKKLPIIDPLLAAHASWEKTARGDTRPFVVEWSVSQPLIAADFYPFASDTFEVMAETESLPAENGRVRFRKKAKISDQQWPGQLEGLLVAKIGPSAPLLAYETTLSLRDVAASRASIDAGTRGAASASSAPGGEKPLLLMFAFAFLGGLILNIMPCVLPVIALKILGFVNQSKESPGQVRKLGLIYGLGILVSFLALAAIVIAVQAAGRGASWGMQFQSPQFLVAMTVLVTLVSLNLFGLFEINLGGRAMGAATELISQEGTIGAFFNGVLATALATPCTAPLLAPALGFAFSQSAWVIILIFLTVGLGLAAPYVILSFQPAWLKYLPRPGVWMEKFKVAMGFPMLATAVWLFSLTSIHFSGQAALWFGLWLVMLSLAAWVWGEFVQRGRRRRALAVVTSLLLVLIGYVYLLEGQLHWRSPGGLTTTLLANQPDGIPWQRWSPQAVAQARASGRPVLVDFTARWCLTCQANKLTSLEIPAVRQKLKEINAVALLADYTRKDDAITAELKRFGRAAVPLVVVYSPSLVKEPIVLPALLTPKIVLDALGKAAAGTAASSRGQSSSG